jgi:hypothetical protein
VSPVLLVAGLEHVMRQQPYSIERARTASQASYRKGDQEILLGLEMLTGVTVMGPATKCREVEDRLRTLGVREKFANASRVTPSSAEYTRSEPRFGARRVSTCFRA